jgi:cation diffusion facilitator family transporter
VQEDRLQRTLRVTFIGMAVNGLLAAGKLIAGIVGNSYALIADAVESFADIGSSIVVWRGVVVAAAPADAEHPYGHGKAEPIATAIVAAILIFAAIGIAAEAIRQLFIPREAPALFTLIVLLATVVIKEALYRFARVASDELGSTVVKSDAWHHRSDAITSLAAAIGISIAVFAGPAFVRADSVAAIIAAVIIFWNGWRLLRPALDELMDAAPGRDFNANISRIAEAVPGVDRVEKCFARKAGYNYFVDLHVEVDPEMTVREAHDIAHVVKDEIRRRVPTVSDVLVHIEPSGRRGDFTNWG